MKYRMISFSFQCFQAITQCIFNHMKQNGLERASLKTVDPPGQYPISKRNMISLPLQISPDIYGQKKAGNLNKVPCSSSSGRISSATLIFCFTERDRKSRLNRAAQRVSCSRPRCLIPQNQQRPCAAYTLCLAALPSFS